MWLSVFAAWVVASIVLYGYLVVTAKEPRCAKCMDCRRTDCAGCEAVTDAAETDYIKKAA